MLLFRQQFCLGRQLCNCDVEVLCIVVYLDREDFHTMTTKHKRNTSMRKTPWDSHPELLPMEDFIRSNYLDSFNRRHPPLGLKEAELLNSFEVTKCRFCGSISIKKNGKTSNGIQRYKCNECHHTFNILTNTLFDNHKVSISEWIEFLLDLFRFESLSVTSKTNKNSATTTKYWLHKLFLLLEDYQTNIVLEGNVYLDETFYKVIKSDLVKKDDKELRGLSRNQYCIGIAYDGTYVYTRLEGIGKTSQIRTMESFQNHIKSGSHLIHDKEKSHNKLVKLLSLTDESYDGNEIKKLSSKENPLYQINHMCDLLQKFLNAHPGFNRDDLQNYLNLFSFIMNPPRNQLEKVKFLLNSAISCDKKLTFREFYKINIDKINENEID